MAGTLYIGVNDDGTVCGIDDVDGTMLRVTNAVRDTVRPDVTMFVECHNDLMDEKPIVCNCSARYGKTVLLTWKRDSSGGCLCSPRCIYSSSNRGCYPKYD